jgi:hypothetical protein
LDTGFDVLLEYIDLARPLDRLKVDKSKSRCLVPISCSGFWFLE